MEPSSPRRVVVALGIAAATLLAGGIDATKPRTGEWVPTKPLPVALSDFGVAVVPGRGIYVSGGCLKYTYDPLFGYNVCDYSSAEYATNRAFKYVAAQNEWEELPPAPHGRMRHDMAELNGSLYLVGGADVYDNVITAVDVFDLARNEWVTSFEFPEATSDLAAFTMKPAGSEVALFVAGGYTHPDYVAQSAIWRLDPLTLSSFEKASDLLHARGDFSAVTLRDDRVVLSGGWTNVNNFVAQVNVIEIYLANGTLIGVLNPHPRADFAMATDGERIYELGGEQKIDGVSYPRRDVNRYTIGADAYKALKWKRASLPIACFRSGAAVWGKQLFAIGGACLPAGSTNATDLQVSAAVQVTRI